MPWLLSLALLGTASPVVAKDLACSFRAKGLSMSFGALDPSSGLNAGAVVSPATLSADSAGDCDKAVTMTIDADGGSHYSGSRRLRSASGSDFIPYTLVGIPISVAGPGNARYTQFTFSGVILWSSYADAPAGNYSDTVMISVIP